MRYCRLCVLPDTRPGITIDADGVCAGCRGHKEKQKIDWAAREVALRQLVDEVKSCRAPYDCIVPVSGGKDSWAQVIKAKELGLKVLAITWRPPARTSLGQRNLDNLLKNLNVDHIDYTISPDVEKRFMVAAFERKGATAIPMHMALFAIPTRFAVQLGIRLIVWGENPQLEYGGTERDRLATDLDLDWIRRHGVTNQTEIDDWIGAEGLTPSDLVAYQLPSVSAFVGNVKSIFLGSYINWSSFANEEIARQHGFETGVARTGVWDFADLDDDFISLHHFLKWYKFGMTRAFDNLSMQIRYNRLNRNQAIAKLRELGPQVPHRDIDSFCKFVGKSVDWFFNTAERFRNREIWVLEGGTWRIPNFLIQDWQW